jgi:hypothetical protein
MDRPAKKIPEQPLSDAQVEQIWVLIKEAIQEQDYETILSDLEDTTIRLGEELHELREEVAEIYKSLERDYYSIGYSTLPGNGFESTVVGSITPSRDLDHAFIQFTGAEF